MHQQTIVCVELLDEGSPTLLLTPAETLGNGLYKLLTPKQYDPEDIVMQFLPGSVVRCEKRDNGGKEILYAVEQVG